MKLEIYDAGVYSYEEHVDRVAAKNRMMELGAAAHKQLLEVGTADIVLKMTEDEYAIVGKHHNVWFSARMAQ